LLQYRHWDFYIVGERYAGESFTDPRDNIFIQCSNFTALKKSKKKNPCEYNLFLFPPLVPGHYVPQLARKIVEYNKVSPYPFINLKESL
jgi:hypothetical protein